MFLLKRKQLEILQVNIGWRCNQACHHCHVDAGPNRTENMDKKTINRLIELLKNEPNIHTVDITGGAPELNPYFQYFVCQIRKMGKLVIDRCNLTVLFESGQLETACFLANNQVQIIASLPCYLQDNVNKQRGNGVFEKSIRALKTLNDLGYGKPLSRLQLNLVYNPIKAILPAKQVDLEHDYKSYLKQHFQIEFNNLFTITNMPINRYAHYLKRENLFDNYMLLLANNFNKEATKDVMCTKMLSVAWDGTLYDCDFNQMLNMPINQNKNNIWEIEQFSEVTNDISLGNHCYGCTAGAGSSCGGSLVTHELKGLSKKVRTA